MNIFVLDQEPWKAAEYHCDQHVVKMVLETAQMLSTALRARGFEEGLYKSSYQHHPCTVWAGEAEGNLSWLTELGMGLLYEYTKRYHKVHASSSIIHRAQDYIDTLDHEPVTPRPLAMPDKYKTECAVESYRAYYIGEKMRFARYVRAPMPEWLASAQVQA